MTILDKFILDALLNHGHLDRNELTRLGTTRLGASVDLPRGMPGHYILKDLEDRGLIKGRLSTRDQPTRLYQIEEAGRSHLKEMADWPAA